MTRAGRAPAATHHRVCLSRNGHPQRHQSRRRPPAARRLHRPGLSVSPSVGRTSWPCAGTRSRALSCRPTRPARATPSRQRGTVPTPARTRSPDWRGGVCGTGQWNENPVPAARPTSEKRPRPRRPVPARGRSGHRRSTRKAAPGTSAAGHTAAGPSAWRRTRRTSSNPAESRRCQR